MRYKAALMAAALLTAPALASTPREEEAYNPYPALRIMDGRVATISYRLTAANANWCGTKYTMRDNGVRDVQTTEFPDSMRAKALAAYDAPPGFEGLLVIAVVPKSLADKAGVRVGQDGVAVYEKLSRLAPIGDKAEWFCKAGFSVAARDDMYAATDGRQVQISAALINRTKDDDELAALLAHELSHIILDHPGTLKGKRSIARVKQTERDADRLSVWLMVRAGYDPRATVRFWTHYGPTRDKGIFNAPTHENWKERVARLTSEIAAMEKARVANPDAMPAIQGLKRYDR
jgi:beta-barrel assembly-enhancing protease